MGVIHYGISQNGPLGAYPFLKSRLSHVHRLSNVYTEHTENYSTVLIVRIISFRNRFF